MRPLKNGYFVIEGLNSFAVTFYLYYFYFFTQRQFGFGDQTNLILAALNGGVYALAAWWGGRFAQRRGYFAGLKTGLLLMAGSVAAGTQCVSATAHVLVMCGVTVGSCFTWPALEALVSDGESRAGLQRRVGLYNVVWAGTGALAYFLGGALLDRGGVQSFFLVPLGIQIIQFTLTLWLERCPAGCRPRSARQEPRGNGSGHSPRRPKRGFSPAGLVFQSVRLHCHQHAAGGHAGFGATAGVIHHTGGVYCSVWCLRAWRRSSGFGGGPAGIIVSAGCCWLSGCWSARLR